ncbi:EAL domain-containing protein [Gloeothece verrucosa]|nr:EAL domain-containing protein [Gloeothece verrucosa]
MALCKNTVYLLVLEYSGYRQIIKLTQKTYSLGREASNAIVIDFQKVSRKHATLIQKKDPITKQYVYWILDGNLQGQKSHNGLFVNGRKCYVKELKDGDKINFGCQVNAVYHAVEHPQKLMSLKTINENTTPDLFQEFLEIEKELSPIIKLESTEQEDTMPLAQMLPLSPSESYNTNLNFFQFKDTNPHQASLDEQLIKNFDLLIEASKLSQAESSLQRALEKQEFALYYQPQYNLKTKKIDSLEVLLRWQHPKKGIILPHQFIPVAEKTELIIPIGEWVLKQACQQMKIWQQLGLPTLSISVNLSAKQFRDSNLMNMISRVLNETGIISQLLELEITEKTIMKNEDLANQILADLKNLGVRLSLDNFGREYASLSYLQKYPFHTVKLDQSFIKNFTSSSQQLALLSAVIAWGRFTKLNIVAGGVETDEQLKLLSKLTFEKIQGYKISLPLTVTDATKLLLVQVSQGS